MLQVKLIPNIYLETFPPNPWRKSEDAAPYTTLSHQHSGVENLLAKHTTHCLFQSHEEQEMGNKYKSLGN